jgi:drug/metabolite transporter (DMT)-like permease
MNERGTILAFLGVVLFAGVNAVAVRASNAELAPFWGAALRFALAGAIFWLLVAMRRPRLPRGVALRGPLIYGLLAFGVSYALLYYGLEAAHAGPGQVTLALVPLLTLLLAVAQRQERFQVRGLVGAIVSAVGIVVIFGDQLSGDVPLTSLLALLAGAAVIAESGIVARGARGTDPYVMNAVGMTVGVAFLLGLSFLSGETRTLPAQNATWLAVGYLVTFGSVGVFALALRVLREWPASKAAYQFLLMPLVTIVVAASLVGEIPSLAFLVGGAIVLSGVYVGAFARGRLVPGTAGPPGPAGEASPASQARRPSATAGAYALGADVEPPLPNC